MSGGSYGVLEVAQLLFYGQCWSELLMVTSFGVNEALGVRIILQTSLGFRRKIDNLPRTVLGPSCRKSPRARQNVKPVPRRAKVQSYPDTFRHHGGAEDGRGIPWSSLLVYTSSRWNHRLQIQQNHGKLTNVTVGSGQDIRPSEKCILTTDLNPR